MEHVHALLTVKQSNVKQTPIKQLSHCTLAHISCLNNHLPEQEHSTPSTQVGVVPAKVLIHFCLRLDARWVPVARETVLPDQVLQNSRAACTRIPCEQEDER